MSRRSQRERAQIAAAMLRRFHPQASGKLGRRTWAPPEPVHVYFADEARPERPVETVAYLRSLPYADYLRSAHWQTTRDTVLRRWAGRCEECGAVARDVHHLTYARLGRESMQDLTPLCRRCHAARHHLFPAPPSGSIPPARQRASAIARGESKDA